MAWWCTMGTDEARGASWDRAGNGPLGADNRNQGCAVDTWCRSTALKPPGSAALLVDGAQDS